VDGYTDLTILVSRLRNRSKPFFFFNKADKKEIVDLFNDHYPNYLKQIIETADDVCEHKFDLLGSGLINLDEIISNDAKSIISSYLPWHIDFKSGFVFTETKYYKRIKPSNYPGGYDIKVPWELSRFHFLAWLGQAYWFTDDEKYAREFVAQVTDWIETNPPGFGVNWACAMDVAIRAVNWLWGYYYFQNSKSMTDDFIVEFMHSLLVHGKYIEKNLEWSEKMTGNHYLTNLVGLIYLGVLIPELKEAKKWREFGLRELENELDKQVYSDGVGFEASIAYHRFATELLVSSLLLFRLNGVELPKEMFVKLEKMFDFIFHYTKPDGNIPQLGDNDNGRLHRLKIWVDGHGEWNDHRYLLAIGAMLFEREDFAFAAGDQWEDAIWFFGSRAIEYKSKIENTKIVNATNLGSRSFPNGGIYIFRDNDIHIIVDAGSIGQNGIGGHAHNDVFSFELFAYGFSWIVDPGTYLYTMDYEERHKFRSTKYHNTIQVDEVDQYQCSSRKPFRMTEFMKPKIIKWQTGSEQDELIAEYFNPQAPQGGILHRRQFVLDKYDKQLIIKDYIEGQGGHSCAFSLHSPAKIQIKDNSVLLFNNNKTISVIASQGNWTKAVGWMSPAYGTKVKINHLSIHSQFIKSLLLEIRVNFDSIGI